jgi:hypothetical protein
VNCNLSAKIEMLEVELEKFGVDPNGLKLWGAAVCEEAAVADQRGELSRGSR